MNNLSAKKTLRIYAAGGCGINIVSALDFARLGKTVDIFTAYIDTSKSDIPTDVEANDVYVFRDTDGSGKLRKSNHELINDHVREILLKHKPCDFNIIVSSAGGGTGPVVAPELASELISRGLNVIVFAIGSSKSEIELENTIATLANYSSIANLRDAPVILGYYHNSLTMPPSEVDKRVIGNIENVCLLLAMTKVTGSGLDTADVTNWLQFHKTTSFGPQLASLVIVRGDCSDALTDLDNIGECITVCTLAADKDSVEFHRMVDYQSTGILPSNDKALLDLAPMHYIIMDGRADMIYDELNKELSVIKENRDARPRRKSALASATSGTKSGVMT